MAIKLKDTVQVIRGKKADIAVRTGANGEMNWADDTYELYIHDGKTRGGHLIGKASGTAGVVGGAGIAVSTSDGISTVSIKRDPTNVLYATTDGAGVRLGNSGGLQVTAQNALDLRVAEGGGIIVDSSGVKIDSAVLSSVFRYAGQVNSVDDLPSDAQPGDVYDVKDSGANYVWSGTSWDNLGGIMSVDAAPMQGGTNPVASGGVYDAIQANKLSGDGTTVTINNGIISVPEYEGATADTAATSGLVPPAAAGDQNKYLGGDGEWHEIIIPSEVALSDSVTSTSSTTAASSKAVKTAYDRASTAITNASTAKSAADAAQEAADAAQTTADEAKTAAQNAASAASTAQSAASAAQNTANSATTAATNAQNAADAAQEAADAAQTTANSANANSGVTAGTYGPTSNATPAYGATFEVPAFTVNVKGKVTAAVNRTVKIPAVPEYEGATASAPATSGLVPPATAGQEGYVLGGDGDWHPADSTPVGTIVWSAATQAPNGYLLCNGATVGRSTYAALFDAIGTTYGAGDGSTTFALPNLIGRVAWGGTSPGQYLEAGLPGFGGSFQAFASVAATGSGDFSQAIPNTGGQKYNIGTLVSSSGGEVFTDVSINPDPIYGNSDTVQPPALTLVPYIKAFSAAPNQGMVDLTALANDIAALDAERLKQIGQIQTFASTNLPEGWMICDGSSVLFSDWPEFQQVYNEGRFTGMTISEANPAQVGKLVTNGSSGVYLPDLEGLYEQASSAANAGGYLTAGLPNIKGRAGGIVCTPGSDSGAIRLGSPVQANIGAVPTAFVHAIMDINASLSSAIYSESINTVQPPSVRYVRAMYLGKPNAAAA